MAIWDRGADAHAAPLVSGPTEPCQRHEPSEPQEAEPEAIGPIFDPRQAREWALVLQSQGIGYVLEPRHSGWFLHLPPAELARGLDAIDLYERENENWPPPAVRDVPRHAPSSWVAAAFVAMCLFFAYVTGPAALGSSWFALGRSDATLFTSQPWRSITALTLHADARHVLGNALSGTIFGTMVARRIGPGAALLALIVSGAAGNAMNALYHHASGHRSIGASTAVFAAIGMLAALQTVLFYRRSGESRRFGVMDLLAPVIGGLALLGALGSDRHSDIWAHGFGFLAGVLLGVGAGATLPVSARPPSRWLQLGFGALASGLVVGAWWLARTRL
jgi:membrane associated rhomboid family serine protease